ncbi:uncharacterized protein LOC127748621 isoform X2 [Frankliniella occidentalis]|uniref:Uncharacterized protein LOC127748621 isoform X2 n=1 Tax=Frankliniella occidentalis TaxID=133901 RepID=A0A9C6XRA5_FRAOC|nr:uncharacterized protein LOC127748621 isoform X2 [Frankliniella occidentalis]
MSSGDPKPSLEWIEIGSKRFKVQRQYRSCTVSSHITSRQPMQRQSKRKIVIIMVKDMERMKSFHVSISRDDGPSQPTRIHKTCQGPWTANVERFSMCEEPNRPLYWRWFFRTSHYNPQKPTELQLLTGNKTGRDVPYDDSLWMKISFAVWSNNQWKENSFVMYFQDKACSNIRDNLFPDFYRKVYKKTDTTGVCTISPVSMSVHGYYYLLHT